MISYLTIVFFLLQIPFNGSRAICRPCWQRLDRALQNQLRQQVQDQREQGNPNFNLQGYTRAANTASRCLFQNCINVVTREVPMYVKFHLLHNHNFYIPQLARVCNQHIRRNDWEELIAQRVIHEFNSEHVLEIINLYKWGLEQNSQLDFENIDGINDDALHLWTGITKNDFHNILQETPSLGARSERPATVLGIYLTKIRTGEPDERLATKFKISRRTLERKLRIARECLTAEFVPRHLGLDHMTREEAVARNLTIPAHIFGGDHNAAIFVFDGTYLYVQKSSNFLFQRITYSLHKYRNLVKPFLVVCTDGYIVDVVGPYAATTSDATIMRSLMEDENSAWHWFLRERDVFILDRGFRDSIASIEECGYIAHMPPTRARGEQLSTIDANKSRLITMTRWVVETINGRFKKNFKIFRHTYFNVALPNMMTDFKITAALINSTRQPYEDSIYAGQFINIINENINRQNELGQYVQENNLNRQRVAFMPVNINNNEDFADFPELTYEDLILFTLGTYHLRIARSYCHEHLRPNGLYILELYRQLIDDKVLMRGRIQSRHVRNKQYYCYILVNPARQGRESIEQYYCSCIHGRRTVGSCAHIASIIYYLSWARHQEQIDEPAAFLDDVIIDIDLIE